MDTNTLHNSSNDAVQTLEAGDSKTFSELYQQHYLHIYYFAKKFVGDPDLAEDITAEAFIKLWQETEKKQIVGNVKAFLHVATKNGCLDKLKVSKSREEKHKEIQYLMRESLRIEFNAADIKSEVMEAIYAEIEKLPAESKKIFKLAFIEGLKSSEIAKLLNLSENTVYAQKGNALKKLRLALKDEQWMILLFILFYSNN